MYTISAIQNFLALKRIQTHLEQHKHEEVQRRNQIRSYEFPSATGYLKQNNVPGSSVYSTSYTVSQNQRCIRVWNKNGTVMTLSSSYAKSDWTNLNKSRKSGCAQRHLTKSSIQEDCTRKTVFALAIDPTPWINKTRTLLKSVSRNFLYFQ